MIPLAYQTELTHADKDRIVKTYVELGNLVSTKRRLNLPYEMVRDVLKERGALKEAKKGKARLGVIERESDGPVSAAGQIGRIPLFKLIDETLTGFDRDRMSYRGRVCNLDDLMREVNRQRKILEMPQVDYNPAWLV